MANEYRIIYGPIFNGYQGRVNDRSMPRDYSDSLMGVICSDGGVMRTPGTVKNTSITDHVGYSAGFTSVGSTWVRFLPSSGTFPELGARWTILGAFQLSVKDQVQYIFDRVLTISASPYHAPALRVNADNTLSLQWVTSAAVNKDIASIAPNEVTTGTTYYFICRRYDDGIKLYVATAATSFAEWASGTGLGDEDFPSDTGTHYFVIGANGTNSPPDSDHLDGFVDGITILELALDSDELDMGYLEWPQPLMDRCTLHCPLEAAVGAEFQDLSQREHTGTHDADVTHHQTALLGSPTPIQLIDDTRTPDGRQHVNLIADGSLYASRLNA